MLALLFRLGLFLMNTLGITYFGARPMNSWRGLDSESGRKSEKKFKKNCQKS